MAIGQALSWNAYVTAVTSHGLGRAARPTAVAIFALEVIVAVGLLADIYSTPTAALAVIVSTGWAVIALQAFIRRRNVPNCACFGRFMRQELRWWVLLEDAAFVGLAVLHLRSVL
jgi:hypothetical protein